MFSVEMGNLSPGGPKLFHVLLQAPVAAECLKPADSPQSASKLSRSKVRLRPVLIIPSVLSVANSEHIYSNRGTESLFL